MSGHYPRARLRMFEGPNLHVAAVDALRFSESQACIYLTKNKLIFFAGLQNKLFSSKIQNKYSPCFKINDVVNIKIHFLMNLMILICRKW